MRTSVHLFVSAAALLPALSAQVASPVATRPDVTAAPSFERVHYDATGPQELWARGRTYKAHFGPQGSTYVPFLGSDAPRNFPLTFDLVGASVGARELPLAPAPTIRREDDRVILDHGALLEVYDLTPDSIEQSFHLAAGRDAGALRLRLRTRGELAGCAEGRALRFDGPSGGVRYGEAIAFDDAGLRVDVESRLDGDTIELEVPDVFSRERALVVDPVLTTLGAVSGTIRARRADVAYSKDTSGGRHYLVYEYDFSSNDTDVFGVDIRPDDQVVDSHWIDLSSAVWTNPRVSCLNGMNAYLVVSEARVNPSANSIIVGRVRSAFSPQLGGVLTISANPGVFDCTSPDVGSDSRELAGGRHMVVWESRSATDGDIHGRMLYGTGSFATDVFSISSSTQRDEGDPSVSNSAGQQGTAPEVFNIVWERERTATNHDIWGARITANGFLDEAPFPIDSSTRDTRNPSVSGTAPQQTGAGVWPYAVAYEAENTLGSDIWLAICGGRNVLDRRDFTLMEYAQIGSTRRDPAVVCTGDEFVLAYAETADGTTSQYDVYMATFGLVDVAGSVDPALAERHQLIAGSSNYERRPSIVSDWDAGEWGSNEAFLVYDGHPSIGTAFSAVRAARIESWNAPDPLGVQFCGAEWNSAGQRGWIAAYGSQSATTLKTIIAHDLPVGSFGFVIVSRDSGFVANPGGSRGHLCLAGSIGRYSSTASPANVNGQLFQLIHPTAISQPGGPVAAAPGETWRFQCWHRDSFAGQPTSNFTNAVAITFE